MIQNEEYACYQAYQHHKKGDLTTTKQDQWWGDCEVGRWWQCIKENVDNH